MPTTMGGPLAIFEHKRAAIGQSNQWIYPEQDSPCSDFLRRLGEFARKNGYDSNAGGATEGGVVAPPFAYGANYAALEQPHLLRFVLVFA